MKRFAQKRLPIVAFDLAEAGEWYEERNPKAGLPEALDREVESVVFSLSEHALHHRLRFRDVRRAPLVRFGFYGVYYVVRDGEVIVIAVCHDRRHPGHLHRRWREIDAEL